VSDFKSVFDEEMVRALAARVARAWPEFDAEAFAVSAAAGLDALELMARSTQIAQALSEHLPEAFEEAAAILTASMGAPDEAGGLEGMGGFVHMPLLEWVALAGIDEPEAALDALEQMTTRFSAEFAIRPFIVRHQEVTMARMEEWSRHDDWRVRRLASEGSRPRLPWGIRLKAFVEDPTPTLEILERLVEDEELIVRRSVANHLNDVSKDHEDLAAEVARGWWDRGSDEARWAAKHALRTLVKRGHPGALAALGFSGAEDAVVEGLSVTPDVIAMGEEVAIAFDVVAGEEAGRLVVDYALDRALANGKRGRKVFKIKVIELEPGDRAAVTTARSFKPLSTRTYYAGTHHVEVLLNGRVAATASFELTE
jgi:3-methyladenine DNA glycosylase AlkC